MLLARRGQALGAANARPQVHVQRSNIRLRTPLASGRALASSSAKAGNIVVAVDNSKASWSSVKWALQNLHKEGMVLHLMHVVPKESSAMPVSAAYGLQGDPTTEEEVAGNTRSFVADLLPALESLGRQYGAKCEVDVVQGKSRQHVGAAICERSEALDAVVVVVTHQRYGLLETLFSHTSVSDYVAKNCKRPVLVYQHVGKSGGTAASVVQPGA